MLPISGGEICTSSADADVMPCRKKRDRHESPGRSLENKMMNGFARTDDITAYLRGTELPATRSTFDHAAQQIFAFFSTLWLFVHVVHLQKRNQPMTKADASRKKCTKTACRISSPFNKASTLLMNKLVSGRKNEKARTKLQSCRTCTQIVSRVQPKSIPEWSQ